MTRTEFERLIALAEEIGTEAAWVQHEAEEAEAAAEAYEAEIEGRDADDFHDRAYGNDDGYRYGCGEYDTVDSRGRKLRPRYNEAGEWCGM